MRAIALISFFGLFFNACNDEEPITKEIDVVIHDQDSGADEPPPIVININNNYDNGDASADDEETDAGTEPDVEVEENDTTQEIDAEPAETPDAGSEPDAVVEPTCSPSMDDERQGECFDGIDNDCDGAVDYDDAGCFGYCNPSTNCDDGNPLTEDFCSGRSWTCQHTPLQFQTTICGDSRGGICAQCNSIQVREDQVCVVLVAGIVGSVEAWPDQDHDSIPELDPVDGRQSDAEFDDVINPACQDEMDCDGETYCGEGFCQPLYNPASQFLIRWQWDGSFSRECIEGHRACDQIGLEVPEDLVFTRFLVTCVDNQMLPLHNPNPMPITYNGLPPSQSQGGIIISREENLAGCFVSLVGYCGEDGEECWNATEILNDPETTTPNGMRQFGDIIFAVNEGAVASGTAGVNYPTNFTLAWWIPLPANN